MAIDGITESELAIIKSIIETYRSAYEFYLYGSRVKGDFRFLSDLDLMIKGQAETDFSVINDLKMRFDNSNLSYVVNISDYYRLDEHFYELIKPDLVKI